MLNFASPDSMPGQVAAVATAVEALAHKYCWENVKQVLKTIERLHKMTFTSICGEAVITEAEAQSYLDRYLELMALVKLRRRGRRSRQWTKQKQITYHEFRFLSS